ncbi:MAG: DUF4142 domain-containing protein [Candidatus Korobacteraceae bacterium]
MNRKRALLLILGLLICVAGIVAQTGRERAGEDGGAEATPEPDAILQNFLTHAFHHGRLELYLAQMAASRALNHDVKEFAVVVTHDRTRLNAELFELAKQKRITIQSKYGVEENPRYETMLSRLAHLSGMTFDRAYLEQSAENHAVELQQYLHLLETTSDTETQLFASQQVSRLHDRLRRAYEILRNSENHSIAQMR